MQRGFAIHHTLQCLVLNRILPRDIAKLTASFLSLKRCSKCRIYKPAEHFGEQRTCERCRTQRKTLYLEKIIIDALRQLRPHQLRPHQSYYIGKLIVPKRCTYQEIETIIKRVIRHQHQRLEMLEEDETWGQKTRYVIAVKKKLS